MTATAPTATATVINGRAVTIYEHRFLGTETGYTGRCECGATSGFLGFRATVETWARTHEHGEDA